MSGCAGELVWHDPEDPFGPFVICTVCDNRFVFSPADAQLYEVERGGWRRHTEAPSS
jgi:hypothetical protein